MMCGTQTYFSGAMKKCTSLQASHFITGSTGNKFHFLGAIRDVDHLIYLTPLQPTRRLTRSPISGTRSAYNTADHTPLQICPTFVPPGIRVDYYYHGCSHHTRRQDTGYLLGIDSVSVGLFCAQSKNVYKYALI